MAAGGSGGGGSGAHGQHKMLLVVTGVWCLLTGLGLATPKTSTTLPTTSNNPSPTPHPWFLPLNPRASSTKAQDHKQKQINNVPFPNFGGQSTEHRSELVDSDNKKKRPKVPRSAAVLLFLNKVLRLKNKSETYPVISDRSDTETKVNEKKLSANNRKIRPVEKVPKADALKLLYEVAGDNWDLKFRKKKKAVRRKASKFVCPEASIG